MRCEPPSTKPAPSTVDRPVAERSPEKPLIDPLLKVGPRVSILPVVHGSGDFAVEVRRILLQGNFDAVCLPLPPSFQEAVEKAVLDLPTPSIVVQRSSHSIDSEFQSENQDSETPDETWRGTEEEQDSNRLPWERLQTENEDDEDERFRMDNEYQRRYEGGDDDSDEFTDPEDFGSVEEENDESLNESLKNALVPEDGSNRNSFVPIDPCQPVIAAIRTAMGEHIPRCFIDLETDRFEPYSFHNPDPYSLKKVAIERFAAAMLPSISRPASEQRKLRIQHMAYQLRQLSIDYKNILVVCSVLDWPWIREAYFQPNANPPENEHTDQPCPFRPDPDTLYFMFGELPYITKLYEQARQTLSEDDNLSIDGVKRLLIAARHSYKKKLGKGGRKITPLLLRQCLQYIRNLTLLDRRLTPDLFTIVTAAKQIGGDTFAYHVLRTAKKYRVRSSLESWNQKSEDELEVLEEIKIGMDQIQFPDGEVSSAVSRLPGPPRTWSTLEIRPKKEDTKIKPEWVRNWNPMMQCSWPEEDSRIERFRATVFDRAKEIIGADAAKSEKFTTSVQDGIDMRETLRHWYEGDIYVKVHPPVRGGLDCVVMLFDNPADPSEYSWKATWYAEHQEESTLAFFATPFEKQPVGPGICCATYGGAMFLFPPRSIPDIWSDPRLRFANTLEQRLVAAAALHSDQSRIAVLSANAPDHSLRQIAKKYKKSLIHVPLNHFGDSTIQQLRTVHVLNGQHVRSYAAEFIRRS